MTPKFVGAAGQFGTAYDRRAADYAAAIEPTFRPAHRRIVELAQIKPGIRVIDLATGTGGVAREAAAAGAQVTGIDVSPGMLEIARDSSPAGITYVLAEAGTLPFPDQTFDVATCGFGLSHMPHADQVLSEVRRVLKPNSTLLASCWGRERFNPSRDAVQATLERHLLGWTDPFGQIMNEELWADPESGLRNLRDAGFDSVEVVTKRLSGTFADARQRWAEQLPAQPVVRWPTRSQRRSEGDFGRKRLRQSKPPRISAGGSWSITTGPWLGDRKGVRHGRHS